MGPSRSEVYHSIFQKYRDFTMIPERTYIKNLRIAEHIADVEGAIVECGVWRGGMIAGIAELLGPNRQYLLFDSFQGLPPAKKVDGEHALAWQADVRSPTYYDNCSAPIEFARRAMEMSRATSVRIVNGWFHETMREGVAPGPVALLRLDADWYESTMTALNYCYAQVAERGLVIVDDYYTWDGCTRALHEFLAGQPSNRRIHQFDNEICVIAPRQFWFYS